MVKVQLLGLRKGFWVLNNLKGYQMSAKTKPSNKQQFYVGYELTDDGYHLYTIERDAVLLLAPKIEFEHDEKEKLMRSTHPIQKLPKAGNKTSGYVTFYNVHKINKKISDSVKSAVSEDCNELDKIDRKVNALKERYQRELDVLMARELEAKTRIRKKLEHKGVVVKRGRFFHRAMLVDDFRVFLKTDFKFAVKPLTIEELREVAADLPSKYRTLLNSCIKTTGVFIDPQFYNEKLKKTIKPKDRKAFVHEELDVDEDRLEDEVLPKIPYTHRLMFWWMNDQVNENGDHLSVLHPRTYHVKNPECQHCGGKFKKSTNECRDCGLKSFQVVTDGEKNSRTSRPKRSRAKLRPVKMIQGKPADTRGVPAKGYSRD